MAQWEINYKKNGYIKKATINHFIIKNIKNKSIAKLNTVTELPFFSTIWLL